MKKQQEPKRLGHNSKNIIDIPGNDNTLGEDIVEYILNLSGPLLNIISEAEDKHKAIQGEPYFFENELCNESNFHGVERKLTPYEKQKFAFMQSKSSFSWFEIKTDSLTLPKGLSLPSKLFARL